MPDSIKRLPLILILFVAVSANASAQTGGQFAITQSVTANGGENSIGGSFGVTGTIAQTSVGAVQSGGNFGLHGGFWQNFFTPTAAEVSVSGRVTTANSVGIANVRVVMSNQTGETWTTVSNAFGNFRFDAVAAGEIYVFTVESRRYQFSVRSQVLSVNDNVTDLTFVADWK